MLPETPDKAQILAKLREVDQAHKASQLGIYYAVIHARSVGLTHQEIADCYGVTEGAIRKLIKRGAK